MKSGAIDLVDDLLTYWWRWATPEDYYLGTIVPAIMGFDRKEFLKPKEKKLFQVLRTTMTDSEWQCLPELIIDRRIAQIKSEMISHKGQVVNASNLQEERQRLESYLPQQIQNRLRDNRQRRARKQSLIERIHSTFETDYLSADNVFRNEPDHDMFTHDEFLGLKVRFVQDLAMREYDLSLDKEQAEAVGATSNNVLVTARAGSGKTRILVTRAQFLQQHCGVSPLEILLLAFNRDAADEIRRRLVKALKGNIPYVMTFHALAYSLVHPEERLIYDDPTQSNLVQSRAIQRVIDEHLQSSQYRAVLRDLMLSHFRDDWERIRRGGFDLPIEELVNFRKALPRETLKGDYVKSFGERLIANILFEHDIKYIYERNFRWDGFNYKPDFTIFRQGQNPAIIEYFGLKGDPEYDQDIDRKRCFWSKKNDYDFIEIFPSDISSRGIDGFTEYLLTKMSDIGITAPLLTKEEIWARIERRAIDRFTGAMKSFVSRCRKKNFTVEEVESLVMHHSSIVDAEQLFLEIGQSIYKGYLQYLENNQQLDFEGLVWQAISLMQSGYSQFTRDKGTTRGDLRKIRYVLIDEFQDFSEMFLEITKQIRRLSSHAEFFCVAVCAKNFETSYRRKLVS